MQYEEPRDTIDQFTMQYDYGTKIHQAACAVPSNGTFSVRVSTVSDNVVIKPRGAPSTAASNNTDIVITSVKCPAQMHASGDGSRCLLSWCPPGEELSSSMESCMRCSPGYFSNDGEGHGLSCKECSLGRFCEKLGCTDCTECSLGKISIVSRIKCSSCRHGTTPNASLNGCTQCPTGKRGSFTIAGICELCEVGKISTVSHFAY